MAGELYAIIGAGSVVLHNVEDDTTFAGIPARKIRNRYDK